MTEIVEIHIKIVCYSQVKFLHKRAPSIDIFLGGCIWHDNLISNNVWLLSVVRSMRYFSEIPVVTGFKRCDGGFNLHITNIEIAFVYFSGPLSYE